MHNRLPDFSTKWSRTKLPVLLSVGGVLTDIRGLVLLKTSPHKRSEAIIYSLIVFRLINLIVLTASKDLQNGVLKAKPAAKLSRRVLFLIL